jgi:hypothetical protein
MRISKINIGKDASDLHQQYMNVIQEKELISVLYLFSAPQLELDPH